MNKNAVIVLSILFALLSCFRQIITYPQKPLEINNCEVYLANETEESDFLQVRVIAKKETVFSGKFIRQIRTSRKALFAARKSIIDHYINNIKNKTKKLPHEKKAATFLLKGGCIVTEKFDADDNCELVYRIPIFGIIEKTEKKEEKERKKDKDDKDDKKIFYEKFISFLKDMESRNTPGAGPWKERLEPGGDAFTVKTGGLATRQLGNPKAIKLSARQTASMMAQSRFIEIFSGVTVTCDSNGACNSTTAGTTRGGEIVSCEYDEQYNCFLVYRTELIFLKPRNNSK
ncbi:MAG: hypothetical protein GY754_32930 [bacterium]|nr:hypothetical protein [bacterium]